MTKRPINETIPIAPLKIIAMDNCMELGKKINELIVDSRKEIVSCNKHTLAFLGYEEDSYLVDFECIRYSTGEGKAIINESVRGKDLFIIADIVNNSIQYQINDEYTKMSADDHYQDLKRIISACSGRPRRIHVIMPFLYEGRQNKRDKFESLDCALALQELMSMGVSNIITFDAHEPRVINSVPLQGFDNFYTTYQFIKEILVNEKQLQINSDHLMVISPDEGGMSRAVYYANILGVDMGMFYKRRNYAIKRNGENPVVSIEFLGNQLNQKDALLVDDMIASGKTILEAAKELKRRNARKVIIAATYGLFTEGFSRFDTAYEEGVFDRIYITNLGYFPTPLIQKPYYVNVDMSRYLALIIDTLNNDTSVNEIQNSTAKIQELLQNQ